MPRKPETRGSCAYCGEVLTRRSVDKHLAGCEKRQVALQASDQLPERLWRLRVQDAYSKTFWLELEMRGSASLTQLDKYLRAIWLECCDHLSEYTLGGWNGMKVAKSRKANTIFQPDLVLRHRYDFGSPSETDILVLSAAEGKPLSRHPISLLARNQIPEETCQECDQQAAWLCMDCVYEEDKSGYLCEKHVQGHRHEESPVPLVNSPRVGMCGYSGPADPPY